MPTLEAQKTATAEGIALSIAQFRERIESRRRRAWLPDPGKTVLERRKHWQDMAAQRAQRIEAGEYIGDELLPQLRDDRAMNALGREFLKAAERGNAPMVGAFIEEGFPTNYQDRQSEETALHISAAVHARKVLRVLIESGLCNYLLRDKGGRLASELAYLFGHDPAVARLLGIKECKQAEAQGITLTRRPQL
ncbi:MAG: ankyrin repeat domain-containing protein [Thiobacillaceae bacterium]